MILKLHPFMTPNFVRPILPAGKREDGISFNESPAFALKEIDAEELSDLCDAFRAEIFTKADKKDPRAP